MAEIGLVSLLNDISTFMGYLMPKISLLKNSSSSIYYLTGEIRGLIYLRVLV